MEKDPQTGVKTLVGIVTPSDWDEQGQVRQVSLSATDDQEYILSEGLRFRDLIHKPVRITGLVTIGANTQRTIAIQTHQILDYQTLFEHVHPQYSRAIAEPAAEKQANHGSPTNSSGEGRHGKKAARPFSTNS